jgi:hypothetical protein
MPDANGNYSQSEVDEMLGKSNAAAAAANAKLELLEGQAEEQAVKSEKDERERRVSAASASTDQPRDFTPDQLSQAVERGEITQETADAQVDLQSRRSLKREVLEEVRAETASDNDARVASAGIKKYKEAFPDLDVRRSDMRTSVLVEVERLGEEYGMDKDAPKTELLAMERVCPNPDISIRERTAESTQHEQGVGGDANSGAGGRSESESAGWTTLSKDRQTYYDHLITQGIFKGRDDPQLLDEMKYIRV